MKAMIKRALSYIVKGVPTYHLKAEVRYLSASEKLKGKRIIITGGGRGLGFAMAKKFVEEGASVLIAGRNGQTLENSAKILGCQYTVLDVSNINSHSSFLKKAESLLGGLDCLVNNAGISLHEADYREVTQESFDAQINTNLKGPFFLTQIFINRIKELKQPASVLFISSETGETVDERPYGWTKAATNSMVMGLAYRLAPDNIRVNAVAPGVTASDMTGLQGDGNIYTANSPSRRIYLPEEVAEIASFLLSDVSGCISGQVITCNNGKTINARWK